MARIRTIKPDFWTDEKISECSAFARLLFIGTWNFADDNGNLPRSSKKLKMQIFPADEGLDCEALVQELLTHGVLREYSVNDDKYLHIKNFRKHQVINKPSKICLPQESDNTTPTPLPEQSNTTPTPVRVGMEGNGIGMEEERTTAREKKSTPAQVDAVPNNSDLMVQMLVGAHPRDLYPTKSQQQAVAAIMREAKRFGGQVQAYEYLLERTKLYAKTTAAWPSLEKKFIPGADRFFQEEQYRADEKLWLKGDTSKVPQGRNGLDILAEREAEIAR